MKRIKYTLLILILFSFIYSVKADLENGSGGGEGITGSFADGEWTAKAVGIKVSILNDSDNIRDVEILVNSNGTYSANFSTSNYPKTHQSNDIKWAKLKQNGGSNNVTVYNVGSLLPESYKEENKNIDLNAFFNNDSKLGNLKNILNYKNNSNTMIFLNGEGVNGLNNGDYILIEPLVKIGNYYGTAYEFLHAKDVRYNSSSTSKCNNDFCVKYIGSVFAGRSDVDNAPLIWNTLYATKTWGKITELKNYYVAADTALTEERINCLKSQSCGRGIGIYKYDEINDKGYLRINKLKTGTSSYIVSSEATFTVYNGSNCTGSVAAIGSGGGHVDFELTPGNYSFKETQAPINYELDSTCHNITIVNGSEYSPQNVNVYNTSTCVSELAEAREKVQPYLINVLAGNFVPYYSALAKEMFKLYQKYPTYNGLLKLTDPTCEVVSCGNSNSSIINGCLTAKTESDSINFNKYDLSCHDSIISDANGIIGFCKNDIQLVNNLATLDSYLNNLLNTKAKTKTFYSNSGRFLIKKVPYSELIGLNLTGNSYGLIAYDKDKNKYVGELSPYLVTATIEKKCYSFENTNLDAEVKKLKEVNIYFGDNDNDGNADELTKISTSSNNTVNTITESIGEFLRNFLTSLGLDYYPIVEKSYSETRKYELNEVYVEKMTGKISTNANTFKYYNVEQGIVSKFDSTSGIIPFSIKYGGISYNSNVCQYEVDENNSLIKNDKLNIEFRIIDTNNPFNRNTKSNWCGPTNCNKNNLTVLQYIKYRPNSYGVSLDTSLGSIKNDPKYTIELTPTDIKTIRNYNKENKYDNYELYCDNEGKCTNSFIYSLKNGILQKYNNNVSKKNYGSISKLIVKGS